MSDATVVKDLNAVYRPVLTAFEQFHRQEHRFKVKYRYKKLVCRYDKLVHHTRCWRRHLLDRIERLGGEADSKITKVAVKDGVKDAYQATQDALKEIFDAINDGVKSAVLNNDHLTHKLLLMLQTEVDHKICKTEAWLRQVDDLGQTYLVTVI